MNIPDCIVLILGGGRGTRLFPLTQERSKPAIGFAGKYRLIDIPISNSINSGFNKIYVLTQFLSASLHGHILHAYRFDNFSKGFVEILSAEESHERFEWFHGTADAVRRVLRHLRNLPQEHVLILSGDHLYKMDFRGLFREHLRKNAGVTVASISIDESEASRMGILDCAPSGRLLKIVEKPQSPEELDFKTSVKRGRKTFYQASMGIYLFNKKVLFDILTRTQAEDFGRQILPLLVKKKYKVYAFRFEGYWRDIGTVKSYYEASLDLIGPEPKFDLFDDTWPIFTRARFLPPSKINGARISHALVADGCRIDEAAIENSIVGLRSRIREKTRIKDSIIIGNDYYERRKEGKLLQPWIGRNVLIERAIVDKNAVITDNCRITDKSAAANKEGDGYCIRDGITIIKRGAILKPGTVI